MRGFMVISCSVLDRQHVSIKGGRIERNGQLETVGRAATLHPAGLPCFLSSLARKQTVDLSRAVQFSHVTAYDMA
jgi:hypothetical protein